jgi:hypothetical protein
MRSKGAQRDSKETKNSCDAKKHNRHLVNSGEFAASPTLFSNRSGLSAGFGVLF